MYMLDEMSNCTFTTMQPLDDPRASYTPKDSILACMSLGVPGAIPARKASVRSSATACRSCLLPASRAESSVWGP